MCSVCLSVDVGEQLHPQFGILPPNSSAFWPVEYVCLGSEALTTTWVHDKRDCSVGISHLLTIQVKVNINYLKEFEGGRRVYN